MSSKALGQQETDLEQAAASDNGKGVSSATLSVIASAAVIVGWIMAMAAWRQDVACWVTVCCYGRGTVVAEAMSAVVFC